MSGIAWLTGYDESAGEQAGPLTPRAAGDPLAGLHAAFAALLGGPSSPSTDTVAAA